jgi:hypothetical protein
VLELKNKPICKLCVIFSIEGINKNGVEMLMKMILRLRTGRILVESPEPLVSTQIYFYPKQGQSVAQQDRDRYECYLWAVEQSGFDPSAAPLAPHQRIVVRPAQPEGQNTVVGAVTGAIIGAAIGAPHDTGKGAVIGTMAGALLGAASDAAQQQEAAAVTRHYDRISEQRSAVNELKAQDYRRAMKACLEGRGYSVR